MTQRCFLACFPTLSTGRRWMFGSQSCSVPAFFDCFPPGHKCLFGYVMMGMKTWELSGNADWSVTQDPQSGLKEPESSVHHVGRRPRHRERGRGKKCFGTDPSSSEVFRFLVSRASEPTMMWAQLRQGSCQV